MARRHQSSEGGTATLEPVERVLPQGGSATGPRRKSITALVDEFLAAVQAHPDGKLLGLAHGGAPNRQESFPETPFSSQRLLSFRLLVRE